MALPVPFIELLQSSNDLMTCRLQCLLELSLLSVKQTYMAAEEWHNCTI